MKKAEQEFHGLVRQWEDLAMPASLGMATKAGQLELYRQYYLCELELVGCKASTETLRKAYTGLIGGCRERHKVRDSLEDKFKRIKEFRSLMVCMVESL